jgi:2'-5' RNA ligase
MRLFIGFFVPENVKNYVNRVQSDLEKLPMTCKLVEPQNVHVSLSFLGEIKGADVEKIKNALSGICQNRKRFLIGLGSINLIPNANFIRVVVLDVLDPSGSLKSICSDIKEKIGGSMKPPHLTLCRVKNVSDKDGTVAGVKSLDLNQKISFVVESISLIKSELSPSGPKYKTVYEAKLDV